MISDLAVFSYMAFLLLSLVSPFLPLRFIGTTVALAGISWAGGRLLDGPTHWSDKGFGYAIGTALLQIFVGVVAAGVSLRFGIAFATARLNKPMSSDEAAQVRAYQRVTFVAAGVLSGLVVAIALSALFAGTSGGAYLDLGIASFAAIAAVTAIRYLPMSKAAPCAALCFTLAVIATVGSGQSGRIVDQAEAYASGRPWCLVGPQGTPPITSTLQLGFFSLPKGGIDPHIALQVQGGDKRDGAHWSIRKQRLETGWGTGVAFCHPQKDYGKALREG